MTIGDRSAGPGPRASAADLAGNASLAASEAVRRLVLDPVGTAGRALGRVPGGLLPRSIRTLVGPAPDADVLAAAAGRPRAEVLALADLAVSRGRTSLARELVDRLAREGRRPSSVEARLAWREGDLASAVHVLDGARHPALRALLTDDLGSLSSTRIPSAAAARIQPAEPGRVLHLVTNSLPHTNAGYTTRTHQIVLAQRDAGLDPHVLTRLGFPVLQGRVGAAHLDLVDGIPYHRSLPRRPLPLRTRERLALEVDEASRLVAQLRPAVLHAATNHLNGRVGLALRERFGIPLVYEVRGFLEESWLSRREGDDDGTDTDRYRLERALEDDVMQQADLVMTLGGAMRDEIAARGVPVDHIVLAPNAVDDRFLELPDHDLPLRRSLGIADDEVTMGMVSTLYRHEGLDTLAAAFAALRRAGHPVRLLVVGDGPERGSLEAALSAAGVRDAAVLTGRVPFSEVHRYYTAVDVFCVPRIRARVSELVTPLKPVEAMAAARAVVASDVGGLREVVDDGVTGVLVPPDDAVALASAVERLIYTPDERQRLGASARSWARDHRTWARVAQLQRQAYAGLGAL